MSDMTVGQMRDTLLSMSENLRYAAGRIRTLEKQANDNGALSGEAKLVSALTETGFAKDEKDARNQMRKMAGMGPVEVAAGMLGGSMDVFVDGGSVPSSTDEKNERRILTPEGALEHLRDSDSA